MTSEKVMNGPEHSKLDEQFIAELVSIDERSDDVLVFQFKNLLDVYAAGKRLHLYTLFSKVTFLGELINLSAIELRALHTARRAAEKPVFPLNAKDRVALVFSIIRLAAVEHPTLEALRHEKFRKWSVYDDWAYVQQEVVPFIRGVVTHVDLDAYRLRITDEATDACFTALFNVAEINEQFSISVQHLGSRIPLPIEAHFIQNTFISEFEFIPQAIIIDPDFLVDVTSIAECFSAEHVMPLTYLMKQFTPKSVSPHLLIGHIANAMLDQFMLNRSVSFDDIMRQLFQQFALEFSQLSNEDVALVVQQSKLFMTHLFQDASMLNAESENNIAYIEPAFVSGKYGLQGRLDAFFMDEKLHAGKIIELKSGRPYKVNEFGLNRNHYVQTLLYDLAVKDAFGDDFVATNFILYCKLAQDRLKRAPTMPHVQLEALKVRNDIIAIMHHLMQPQEGDGLLFRFHHSSFAEAGGFILRDATFLSKTILNLSPLERLHLQYFVKFIAGENYVAKVGGQLHQKRMGFAALWRSTVDEKVAQFNIFRSLEISSKLSDDVYRFAIPENHVLTNFRRGDIVVLYPASREEYPTRGQLLRGSIVRLEADNLTIRLRNPLLRSEVFESIVAWNIEHDFIESSSRNNYRSLFSFYRSTAVRREIFMGLRPPTVHTEEIPFEIVQSLSDIQGQLLIEMIQAGEYYLLWGPPGTGKTSVMLAAYIRYIMEYTEEHLLLVAYTNRAVDEICEVLDQLFPEDYVRIGSRFSVAEKFQDKLLQTKLSTKKTRNVVSEFISSCRLIVGTVSSISGRDELFELKSFDRMVVDEASQLLEPQLIGLAARIPRNIFIGDHKQLPAVVASPPSHTYIENEKLNHLGYFDTSLSMFERLYRRCTSQQWIHAIGRLSHQGRMHQDICSFVSKAFYNSELHIIDHIANLKTRLTQTLINVYDEFPSVQDKLLRNRIEFVDVPADNSLPGVIKMNGPEAQLVAEICEEVMKYLPAHLTIGVICPFRAQIALVMDALKTQGMADHPRVSIDTVERYQGGARDVIIISACASNRATLQAIRSIDVEGVDRKLNVALSRSREQIILVGNQCVLSKDGTYKELIRYANVLNS